MASATNASRDRFPAPEAPRDVVLDLELRQHALQAALASTGAVVPRSMREFLR